MAICPVEHCGRPIKSKGYCEMHYFRLRRHGSVYYTKSPAKKLEFEIAASGCFEITSHKPLSNGYSLMRFHNRRVSIHRRVYEEMFGPIPKGLVVMHKCDNKRCINPEHLEIGTHQDNNRDALERGLIKRGQDHPMAKLTNEEVHEIRRLSQTGMKRKEICEMFGLENINTVTSIKTGRSWSHLD